MRLLVFGATGKVGARLVTEALLQGHEVTAFAAPGDARQTPDRAHARLRVVTGDVSSDPGILVAALARQDAVLWTPSRVPPAGQTVVSERVQAIITAMEKRGPHRLVFLSSQNAAETRRRATLFSALFLLRLLRASAVREAETQERYVRESALDWTIVRLGTLVEEPGEGAYRVGFGASDVPANARVSVEDAAGFLLQLVAGRDHLGATVALFH